MNDLMVREPNLAVEHMLMRTANGEPRAVNELTVDEINLSTRQPYLLARKHILCLAQMAGGHRSTVDMHMRPGQVMIDIYREASA